VNTALTVFFGEQLRAIPIVYILFFFGGNNIETFRQLAFSEGLILFIAGGFLYLYDFSKQKTKLKSMTIISIGAMLTLIAVIVWLLPYIK